jgi:hypothetical protein
MWEMGLRTMDQSNGTTTIGMSWGKNVPTFSVKSAVARSANRTGKIIFFSDPDIGLGGVDG